MDSLLSRFAEDSYWLARYVERAESLVRLLDITESFGNTNDSDSSWATVLDVFGDRQRYRSARGAINGLGVIRYYVLDKNNPNSLVSSIGAAHHNARSLRHLISVEMWTNINIFNSRMEALRARDVTQARLSRLSGSIKDACQLFQGCTRNTLYRDQVWHFYRIGRLVERCDQTTRLVDTMSRSSPRSRIARSEAVEISHWHSLLRAASAYHGYLRVHPREINAQTVAGYVLFDRWFPGSIAFCMAELQTELSNLKAYISERRLQRVQRQLRALNKLAKPAPAKLADDARQQFLDQVQVSLNELHNAIGESCFSKTEPEEVSTVKRRRKSTR